VRSSITISGRGGSGRALQQLDDWEFDILVT